MIMALPPSSTTMPVSPELTVVDGMITDVRYPAPRRISLPVPERGTSSVHLSPASDVSRIAFLSPTFTVLKPLSCLASPSFTTPPFQFSTLDPALLFAVKFAPSTVRVPPFRFTVWCAFVAKNAPP